MNRILLFRYTAVPQLPRSNRYSQFTPRARSAGSAGLMPTEARGNYLPEAPYLRETKTYLNCNSRMHDCQHNTTMSVQFSSSLSQRPIFSFFCCGCYVKLLDYWRAEKNFSTYGGPPEA